jgi:cyclic-di-GMP-binding biofilm dispersal mediator protein
MMGDPLEHDANEVDRMIRINVHAPYHAAVEAARQMPEGGRIIVIGSNVGDHTGFPGIAAYTLTKAAVQGAGARLGAGLRAAWDHRERGTAGAGG